MIPYSRRFLFAVVLALLGLPGLGRAAGSPTLESGFATPPPEARLRAFWWWLNSNVTTDSITSDLTEMKAKGFGGAILFDAGGARQAYMGSNDQVPAGPAFASPAWRELFKHALREADRLGLELSLNLQSGWNLGGPMVTPDDASKKLTWAETEVQGPGPVKVALARGAVNDDFYREVRVLAWRVNPAQPADRPPLKNYASKALIARPTFPGPMGWIRSISGLDILPIFAAEEPAQPGEQDALASEMIDLTARVEPDGTLAWDAPAGRWRILRLGATLSELRHVSTFSEGWGGYALDVLDAGAFRRYWDAVVEPLLADAAPFAGKALRYLHTDSWEVGAFNWTPTALDEFRRRRGYDPVPWLPVIAGRIVGSRADSNRFLHDFRRTLGDLAADNHYRPFSALAAKHGYGIHPESGGPHFTPIDALQCLAIGDIPKGEFWSEAKTHRSTDEARFFVKQPASAAHTSGRPLVAAEGFTNVGLHWQERLWENLKPSFDQACIEGMNRLFWHSFTSSPAEMGVPGQEYFAGSHLNPNTTWWEKSEPFFTYLNRSQFLLQRGLPVADVLYYYGNDVPNFTQRRERDPAGAGEGYDYDAIALEQFLTRVSVRDGRLVLPDGVSYRLLVLPPQEAIALPALRKVRELVEAGATVLGPKPNRVPGLAGGAESDAEVRRIADAIWPRVRTETTAREVLLALGVGPDFAFTSNDPEAKMNYIHRRDGETEIYFLANRAKEAISGRATFRVTGKVPEFWDAVTGTRRFATDYATDGGGTTLPLELAPAGSLFVIFRAPAAQHPATGAANFPKFEPVATLDGAWQVAFDPKWGGPARVEFAGLTDWTQSAAQGIRYYSGTAVYRKTFKAPTDATVLDLGDVRELASVKLNGKALGTVWATPFQIDVTGLLKAGGNELEIEVVNLWSNRVIGDEARPVAERYTKTNIRSLLPTTPLMPSGLLGPVRLLKPASTQANRAITP